MHCRNGGGHAAAGGQHLPGRTTGSLAWRAARGELGEDPAAGAAAAEEAVASPMPLLAPVMMMT